MPVIPEYEPVPLRLDRIDSRRNVGQDECAIRPRRNHALARLHRRPVLRMQRHNRFRHRFLGIRAPHVPGNTHRFFLRSHRQTRQRPNNEYAADRHTYRMYSIPPIIIVAPRVSKGTRDCRIYYYWRTLEALTCQLQYYRV